MFQDLLNVHICMSLKRLATISTSSATQMKGHKDDETNNDQRPPVVPVHGVNVVLGGAMMSGIIIMVFLICYCCHRNQQNRQNNLPRHWRDPGLSMEVYTIEGQQLFEIPEDISRPVYTGPPPSYEEAVVHEYEDDSKDDNNLRTIMRNDDSGLPSYEAALRMANNNESRVV